MKNNYFKGWYFKYCNNGHTIALIPAFHISHGKKTASLQIITDNSAHCIQFSDLKYCEKPLHIKIGSCIFSENGIKLNIRTNQLTVHHGDILGLYIREQDKNILLMSSLLFHKLNSL